MVKTLTITRLTAPLALAMFFAPNASYGVAVVTLTSPTDKPTMVRAESPFSAGAPVEEFRSADTAPFDQTALVHILASKNRVNQADANSHLTLNATEQEIRSAFNGDHLAVIREQGGILASFSAQFSLDIVVDTLTPFFFSAGTSGTGRVERSDDMGAHYSEVRYHFYTPNLNELDFAFGTKVGIAPFGWPIFDFAPPVGEVTGMLRPGETYRLDFYARSLGEANSFLHQGLSIASGTGSAVLIIPEPASMTLLLIVAAIRFNARPGKCRR
jgi:hypothetical protein